MLEINIRFEDLICEQLLNSFEKIKDHLSVNESTLSSTSYGVYDLRKPNDGEDSAELNKFMMEIEFIWKQHFLNGWVDWRRSF